MKENVKENKEYLQDEYPLKVKKKKIRKEKWIPKQRLRHVDQIKVIVMRFGRYGATDEPT